MHTAITHAIGAGAGINRPRGGRPVSVGHGPPAQPRLSLNHTVAANGKGEEKDVHEQECLDGFVYLPRPHKGRECAAISTHKKRLEDKEEEKKRKAGPRPQTRAYAADAAPDLRPPVGRMPAAET